MATLPYVTSPGNIDKALKGIKSAAVPERVSQDFVKTILNIPGGSGDQMTSFLKKIGFANPDGSPSEIYKRFRNPTTSGLAIAEAMKLAYAPLYRRNEFLHKLKDSEISGLLIEETGMAHDSNPVKLTLACIKHLRSFANFDQYIDESETYNETSQVHQRPTLPSPERNGSTPTSSIGLNLGYTINLNLPATSDPAVFDAIFKSLKENLLRNEDA